MEENKGEAVARFAGRGMRLAGKTVVVTGASSGLGRALALSLGGCGANLILVARNGTALAELRAVMEHRPGGTVETIPCDVSDENDVSRMAEAIGKNRGRVDVLVNNAGIGIHKPFGALSNEEMRRQFAVNCFGPFYCLKALFPLLMRSPSAYVLNIGSLAGVVPVPGNGLYAATKAALAHFSESLRLELKGSGVRVGLFLPGAMDTAFIADFRRERRIPPCMVIDPERAAEKIIGMIERRTARKYLYRWMLLPMKLAAKGGALR